MFGGIFTWVVAAVTLLIAGFANVEVVRGDSGIGSVAGILCDSGYVNEFTFKGDGNQILFADLDAEMYMTPGGHDSGASSSTVTGATGCSCGGSATGGKTGGCAVSGTGDTHDESGGTADAGAPGFRLEVLTVAGQIICAAGRPKRPGWDRDPRLACHIPTEGEYILRVSHTVQGEQTEAVGPFLYLLNATLRGVATAGPLAPAFTASKNEFSFSGENNKD
jgi:hypothetical protein